MRDLGGDIRALVESGIRPVTWEDIRAPVARPRARRALVVAVVVAAVATAATIVPAVARGGQGGSMSAAAAALRRVASAAMVADSEAPVSGQSLRVTEDFLVRGIAKGPGGARFHFTVPATGIWSLRPDGTGSEQITLGEPSFPSSGDERNWRALGSLDLVPDHQISELLPRSRANAEMQAENSGLGALPVTPTVLPFDQVRSLPTDPKALQRALVNRYENGRLDVGRTFDLAAGLLEEGAGPAQRSGLYEMIASLPGVHLDGRTVTDVTGVPGVGVSVDAGGVRRQLVFDPATSSVLEERNMLNGAWPRPLPPLTGQGVVGDEMVAYTVFKGNSVVASTG